MAEIIWTEPALNDLDEIAGYIALDNLNAAKSLVQQVFHSVDRLEAFPETGRLVPELHESRYRELIIGPCRVIYRFDGQTVFLIYVVRSERLLRSFIIESRDND